VKGTRPKNIGVLVADSDRMHGQLMTGALRRRPEFRVSTCRVDLDSVLRALAEDTVHVILVNAHNDMTLVRSLHLSHPHIAKVLLLGTSDRDAVINAFRAGARGVFCFTEAPFRLLCKCIQRVYQGQVWVSNRDVEYLLEVVTQVPSLRVVNSRGVQLLTPREEQVVALVADGLSNRAVAQELGLSEHTIKKYLFRIFDKVGVSTRVELVLYAVANGAARQAEWVSA
jgi:DNA-binding NarL/FixJ family response regulator